jgi:putative membrane protein
MNMALVDFSVRGAAGCGSTRRRRYRRSIFGEGISMKHASMTHATIVLATLIASGTLAQAQSGMGSSSAQSPAALSKADRNFANTAAQAGLAEVAEAQLALQQSSNQDVKNFAQRMVDDHSKANDQLKSIASQEGLSVPASPSSADQRKAQALQKLSGAAFDKRYVSDQDAAHKEAVALFTKESKNGKDAALKSFAAQTLPTLQDHYRMVHAMAEHGTMRTSSAY